MPTRLPVSSPGATTVLDTFAAAVAAMKARSTVDEADPFGWFYQSRMHGRPDGGARRQGEPEDWSACKHGQWYFLPWHRMYLLQFERLVRWITSDDTWCLPYWDYPDASRAQVPAAFLDPSSALNDANRRDNPFPAAAATWMASGTFQAFGGGVGAPVHMGDHPGSLELNPHNLVHRRFVGDLSSFQSPLDPLFWIHHANIDRLWSRWLELPGRRNPGDSSWLDTSFDFPDPTTPSRRRTMHVREIETLDLAGYDYEPPPSEVAREEDEAFAEPAPARADDVLTLVGASAERGAVDGPVSIPLLDRATLGFDTDEEAAVETDLFLRLENVGMDIDDGAAVWNVLASSGGRDPVLAGTLAPFGLAGLTASGGRATITFDVTAFSLTLLAGRPETLEVTTELVAGSADAAPYWERAALYTIVS